MLALDIDPYFILVPIMLFELAFLVYVRVVGGDDAIIVQKTSATSSVWNGVYVIRGVSHDEYNRSLSYGSIFEMDRRYLERKSAHPLYGGFKFKSDDTSFTFVDTMSKKKRNLYKDGVASLKDVRALLFP